jgi:hypothetical protein
VTGNQYSVDTTVRFDTQPPTITPSGSLYDARNQADHRNEGLYGSSATLNWTAGDTGSGVDHMLLQVTNLSTNMTSTIPTTAGSCTSTGCGSPLTGSWTMPVNQYADGDYTSRFAHTIR